MAAEAPHRMSEPTVPKIPSVYPRLPSRKPGLQSAMTNPSHHRSVLRSWTSSTVAVAKPHSPRLVRRHLSPKTAATRVWDDLAYTSLYKGGQRELGRFRTQTNACLRTGSRLDFAQRAEAPR